MCDGWASSNVQLTAPLNPAQSRTVRFPGAPLGRGTPLVGAAGRPDGSRSTIAACGVVTGTLATGGATVAGAMQERPLTTARRPIGSRRIGGSLARLAGADGGDVGRIRPPVRADHILAPVARLDVVVQHLPRDLAARDQRRVPPLLRTVHGADVVKDGPARAVVERHHLGLEARARNAVHVEVGARRHLVGEGAGNRLGDVPGQLGPLGQLLVRGPLLQLLVLALGLAPVGVAERGGQLLPDLALLLELVARGGQLPIALGLLLGEVLEVALLVGEGPVGLCLVVRQLLLGLALPLGLLARGGELPVAVGLLLGEVEEVTLLVGQLVIALRLVARQLLLGLALSL